MKVIKKNKGFTLVELIVVIAIIGILAVVLIPSVTGFIDKARMSNDNAYVSKLNELLEYYEIQGGNLVNASAPDIRFILENESEEELDFTPNSKNAGFFYNKTTKKIEIKKFTNTGVLAAEDETLTSPEELFGEGLFLLTKQGNVASEVAFGLRNLGTVGKNDDELMQAYNALKAKVNGLRDSFLKTKLNVLLETFKPANVLYVTNLQWRMVEAQISENPVQKTFKYVMFSEGVTNIPSNNLSIYVTSLEAPLVIPKSVKTIEADSFNGKILDTISVVFTNKKSLIIETGAFSHDQKIVHKLTETSLPIIDVEIQYKEGEEGVWTKLPENPVLKVSNNMNNSENSQLRVVITEQLRTILTNFQFSRKIENGDIFLILKLYGIDGIIGVKKVKVTIIDLDQQ